VAINALASVKRIVAAENGRGLEKGSRTTLAMRTARLQAASNFRALYEQQQQQQQ
jgi:hypothetical protein